MTELPCPICGHVLPQPPTERDPCPECRYGRKAVFVGCFWNGNKFVSDNRGEQIPYLQNVQHADHDRRLREAMAPGCEVAQQTISYRQEKP